MACAKSSMSSLGVPMQWLPTMGTYLTPWPHLHQEVTVSQPQTQIGLSSLELTNYRFWFPVYNLGAHCIENTASHGSSVVAYVFVATETCLPGLSQATFISSGSAILHFGHHVTVL
jgi:hypothetical protein